MVNRTKKGTKKPRKLAKINRFPLIERALGKRTKAELVEIVMKMAREHAMVARELEDQLVRLGHLEDAKTLALKPSGQLTLDSAMRKQWLQLNATERYLNLLEAWLRRGSWEAVGLRGGGGMNHLAMHARHVWSDCRSPGHETGSTPAGLNAGSGSCH